MLLFPFASPRRLILLAVLTFFAILFWMKNTSYSTYLPKYDMPSFTQGDSSGSNNNNDNNNNNHKNDHQPQTETSDRKGGLWLPYKPGKPAEPAPTQEWEYVEDAPKVLPSLYPETPASTSGIKIEHPSYAETQQKIQKLIDWEPLNTPNHWPDWNYYKDKDYDPNRWEGFEW